MAEKENNFQSTVEALFKGMDSFITTKTVVGEAIHINDTILLRWWTYPLALRQEHFRRMPRAMAAEEWEERSHPAPFW